MVDDEGLISTPSTKKLSRLAIVRTLKPGVLALVHSTYAPPGGERTTALVSQRFYWPTLAQDVRECVLSAGAINPSLCPANGGDMLPP